MKPRGFIAVSGLLLITAPVSALAGIWTLPPPNDQVCFTEAEIEAGLQQQYDTGVENGRAEGIAQCGSHPRSCGITVSSMLPRGQFGESEPNDNIIIADPMKDAVLYGGQSYGPEDVDCFYLTSVEPHQKLTVNFQVPGLPAELPAPLPPDYPGWKISVGDAAGNVVAEWPSDLESSNEVAMPTMLPHASTYYVCVKPTSEERYSPLLYQLAYGLEFSQQDGAQPVDVNFFDAEMEPNDTPELANPLASTVTMYGIIDLTYESVVLEPDTENEDPFREGRWGQGGADWFSYTTPGDEMVVLSMCERELCGPGNWFLQVYDEANAAIVDTPDAKALIAVNTQFGGDDSGAGGDGPEGPQAIKFGLMHPGRYFLRISHKRLLTAPCVAWATEADPSCKKWERKCLDAVEDDEGEVTTEESEFCSIDRPLCDGTLPPSNGPCWLDTCDEWVHREFCAGYGAVVEINADDTTSPYNFQWNATKLSPSTADSEAEEDFLNRPSHLQ